MTGMKGPTAGPYFASQGGGRTAGQILLGQLPVETRQVSRQLDTAIIFPDRHTPS